MIEYFLYFVFTVLLSTFFATAGLGSAVALVPLLNMMGVNFDIARASGLFVNFVSTVTASFYNLKKDFFDIKFVVSLVISSSIFAYVGAHISLKSDIEFIQSIFAMVLFFVATMILFHKRKEQKIQEYKTSLLLIAGSIGGFFSGLLGIGGGSIISPILYFFGYDPKKIALGISFVIPFSSGIGFFTYASVIEIDYLLLAILAVAGYLGGRLGNYILKYKVSAQMIKKVLAIVLYLIGFKMIFF